MEADERVDAAGTGADTARRVAAARGPRRGARASGCDPSRSCSCTASGTRSTSGARRAVARAVGFEEVIASHEAAALLGLMARGDTTVADAYLSPLLVALRARRSGATLAARYPGARAEFMQSSGGLVDAEGFRGINAVLSGPAGGVVGHDRRRRATTGAGGSSVSTWAARRPT